MFIFVDRNSVTVAFDCDFLAFSEQLRLLRLFRKNLLSLLWFHSWLDVTCFHPPNCQFPLSGSHKTFHFSYMKFPCLLKFLFIKVQVSSIFKEKQNSLGGTSRNRSRSIGSAVQHFNPYTTEDLLTMDVFIWIYIATTLTLTLTLTLCTNH